MIICATRGLILEELKLFYTDGASFLNWVVTILLMHSNNTRHYFSIKTITYLFLLPMYTLYLYHIVKFTMTKLYNKFNKKIWKVSVKLLCEWQIQSMVNCLWSFPPPLRWLQIKFTKLPDSDEYPVSKKSLCIPHDT